MQETNDRYKFNERTIKEMEKTISTKIEETKWDINSLSTLASHIEAMEVEISVLGTKLKSATITYENNKTKYDKLLIDVSSGGTDYDKLMTESKTKIDNLDLSIAKYERLKNAKDELQRAQLALADVKNQSGKHQKLLETCQDELKKAEQFISKIEHVLIFIANLITGFLFKFKSKLSIATSNLEKISNTAVPEIQPLEDAHQNALNEFNLSKEILGAEFKNLDDDTRLSNELVKLNRDKQSMQTRYQALLEAKVLKKLLESTKKQLNEKTSAHSDAKEKLKAFQQINEMQETLKALRESNAGDTEIQGLEKSLAANTKKFQEAKAALEAFKAKHPIANQKMDAGYLSLQVAAV